MPSNTCIVCRSTKVRDSSVSFHRFPKERSRRQRWIEALDLTSIAIKDYHRVCSRHFVDADASRDPQLNIGRHFASPKKQATDRNRRANRRESIRSNSRLSFDSVQDSCDTSKTEPVVASFVTSPIPPPIITGIGEQLLTDSVQVHEIPTIDIPSSTSVADQIETLKHELKSKLKSLTDTRVYFRISDIAGNDKYVKLYTGFDSYDILLAFFDFLGPSVSTLLYWKNDQRKMHQLVRTKLDPINQFFLTLIKLKLNLHNFDLAVRFGISQSLVSKYITTWICFQYQHLNEIKWMPSPAQVAGTLPDAFHRKYSNTFAIIDGSKIFIQTPSDLHLQASTWSQNKHHNTAKFLVVCTPNGVISYISPLYFGSISDVELTRISGYSSLLQKLEGQNGISIMADKGFTIEDQLKAIGIVLNIPPFLSGCQQLSANDVMKGRSIASLRIHVELAIRRMKSYSILKEEIPVSMIPLANHIVSVCAWLTNFQPALIPPSMQTEIDDTDVEAYFQNLDDNCSSSSDGED